MPDDTRGVLVSDVEPFGPAAMAGVRPGDLIAEVDGAPTPTPDALRSQMRQADTAGVLLGSRPASSRASCW